MHLEGNSQAFVSPYSAVVTNMTADDAGQLSHVFRDVVTDLPYYNAAAKNSALAKYTASHLQESVSLDSSSVLVVKADNKLVGFCFSHLDDGTVWLSWIGVHPCYRRKGLGTALLRALEVRATKVGAHKIWCDSRTDNKESALTLNHFGFQKICTIRNHWFHQDFYLWEKTVD